MSKKFLLHTTVRHRYMWLMALFCFLLLPIQIQAQLVTYPAGDTGLTLGTSDSRLIATIEETDNTVTFKVMAVGELRTDAPEFDIFYKGDVLKLTDKTFTGDYSTTFGYSQDIPALATIVEIEPSLVAKGWFTGVVYHKQAGSSGGSDYSYRTDMNAVVTRTGVLASTPATILAASAGEIKLIHEFYFNKVTPGVKLQASDIGFGSKTNISGGRWTSKWTYVATITYGNDGAGSTILPELFAFRTPSSIYTDSVKTTSATSATLYGTFRRGEMTPVNNLVDATGTATTGSGRLNWDDIVQSGFIYSTSNVKVEVPEYGYKMYIDDVAYDFPSAAEITAGTFSRGTHTFYVQTSTATSASNGAQAVDYNVSLSGLPANSTFYGWAFMNYVFETSNPYPAIGEKITFKTLDDGCTPFQIGTINLVSQPTCASPTGSIQLIVTGGSGTFQYALNGNAVYTDLPANGIIGGLGAGTYYVSIQDKTATDCGTAVSEAITLMSGDSDLIFGVTPTNATSCATPNGILTLNISGGTSPYQYSVNGSTFANIPAGNQLTGLTPGTYVVDVKDAGGCVISSGEVLLGASDGGLQVTAGSIVNTTCGSTDGSFSLTATTGTAPYLFSIDGGITESSAINNVVISNLSAGSHTWEMTDANGCYAEGRVEIANTGANTLSATIASTNAQCDGTSGGSITITVNNGTAPYSYRYDGGTDAAGWISMTGNTVTIQNLPIGSYDIKVKDDTDCIYEYQDVTIIRENTTNLAVGTIQILSQPSCSVAAGSIFVDVTGGSGNYQYVLNNGSTYVDLPSDGIINNLGAGTYVVSVRDKEAPVCGIAVGEAITLKAGDSDLNVVVTATDAASCGVADGVLALTITAGTAPYQYSLNGGTYANVPVGNQLTGLAPATYVVDVKDASGCIVSSGQVIISAADGGLQVIAGTNTSTTCGNADGSFTLTMTTGTAPYQYQIDGGIIYTTSTGSVVISGLTAGNHVWSVTDATGCTAEGREVIANSGANTLAFTATPVDALCDGTGGKITIHVAGGTAPFSYRYNSGAWVSFTGTGVTVENLPQGIYDIEVKDNTECTYQYQDVTIGRDNHTDLQVSSIQVAAHPSCGNADGSIKISVTGGSGTYEYALNGSATYTSLPSTGIIGNLPAGTYRVSVRDEQSPACGTAISESITLNSNDTNMTLGVLATNATSCGVADGILTITINGGTAPYQYSLNGGTYTSVPVGNQLTALTPGIYVVDVKDAGNCIVSSGEVTVGAADGGLQITVSDNISATCDEATGGFTLTANTGAAPYQYQINGAAMQTMAGNIAVVNNLTAGSHVWRVTDATGCTAEGTVSVGNSDAGAVSATVSATNAQCGGFGGSITITAANGTAPYEYSYDGGTTWTAMTGTTATIQNLTEGNYDIQVKDNTGCIYEYQNVVISVESTINLAVGTIQVVTQPTCGTPSGSIQLDVTGGSGTYQYDLNDSGTYTSLPANGIIENLAAGTYRVYIQDQAAPLCGTAISEAISLKAGDSDLALIAQHVNASSCGTTDGSISLNITGGTAPYQYSLNGGAYTAVPAGNQLSGLTAGVYVVNVKDATGCVATGGEVKIAATDGGLQVTANVNTSTTCGNADGSFTLTVTTGTTPYQYQIDGGVIQTMNGNSVVINDLTAGSHVWYVIDATGCFAEGRETIANTGTNTLAAIASATSNAQCDGTSGGSITVTVTNGLAPFQYSYDNGITWTAFTGNTTTAVIQNLSQGVYDILVKDNTGCTYEYQNVVIGRDNTIDLAVGTILIASQPTCADATGSIQLDVTGGSGNYQYALSVAGTYTTLPANGIITGLSAGTYRIYVQDSEAPVCGTTVSETVTLKAGDSDLMLNAVASNASSCGVTDGSISLTITGGTSPYQYSLNGGAYAAVPVGNQLAGLTSGTYVIDIKDATGCVTSSGEVKIAATDGGLNTVVSAVNNTTCGNTTGGFTLTATGTAPFQYQIDGNVMQVMVGNSAVISGLSAGSHAWYVVDATGCFAEGRQDITNTGTNNLAVTASAASNAQCDGTSGGSIAISVTSGVAPFQYSYDGGTTWTAFTGNDATATIQNLAQGVYDILVKDNTECVYEYQNVVIGRDNTIDLTIGTIQVATQPSCANPTGSINVQVSGGSGNYQYALSAAGTYTDLPANGIITGLAAGTYRVYVQDKEAPVCGTAISEAVILTAIDGNITLAATATDASSCGINDGSISLIVAGGTAPYTYTLNGVAVTPSAAGVIGSLTSDVYVINVTDASGCTVTSGEVKINAADGGLQVTAGANVATTCGNTTGSFTLTATGTAPYQYQIDGGVLQPMAGNSATIGNLAGGSHAWYVVDATGCFAEGNEVINNSDNNNFAFTVASIVNAQCDGTDGGSITINVTGGTAPFSYRYDAGTDAAGWITFDGTSATVTIANLSEGSYDIRVKDNTGCIYEYQNAVIGRDNRTDLQVASISVVAQPTCSAATGSILVIVSGGSGSYEYALNGGTTYTALPTDGIISGLAVGTYRVSVRDVANPICGIAISESVTLDATDSNLTLGVTAANASSCGVADGSLTLTITGGTSPYQYSLNGGAYTAVPAGNQIVALTSGVYVVEVKDATGCVTSSGEVKIASADGGLQVAASANTSTTCGNADGSFTLTFSTGTAPYQYQIDGGAVKSTTNGSVTIADLTAGSHVWQVTDAEGCFAEGREVIANSGSNTLAFTTASTDAGCDGTSGGTITITVTNGLAPYQYSYDNGTTWTAFAGSAATATIPNLAVGNYDIQVKDNTGCIFEYQNTVIGRSTTTDLLIGTIQVVAQPTCGTSTGSIGVTVTGGSGTYQYALNGAATYTALPAGGIISNLNAGTYVIYIQDAAAPTCGTVVSEAITLNPSNSSLKVSVASTNGSSCGVNDGALTLTVTGGTAPYQYSLNGGTYTSIPAGNQVTGLASGIYTIDVKDADDCVASSGQVVLSAADGGLQVIAGANVAASCGNATGSFTLTASGTAPYQYQVNGGALQTMVGNSAVISNLAAGNHTWKVSDATGCFAQGDEVIANSGSNTLQFTATAVDIQCDGTNGSINISVTSGVAPYQYSYDNGTTWTDFTGNAVTATIPNLKQGVYDIRVKDNTGCTYEYQDVTINQYNNITPPLANSPQEFCAGATVANLQVTGVGIKWYDAAGNLLADTDVLADGAVYYATQTAGTYCESETRTPVKVIIDAPVLDAPNIKESQSFCAPATLADVATNGNTNLVWYDAAVGGNKLPLTTLLEDGESYYAAKTAGGTCEGSARTEMTASLTDAIAGAPVVMTPQHFCEGAVVGNLAVPNNQIVWYTTQTGGSPLANSALLTAGTYYAAQSAGSCESTSRASVEVILDQYPAPVAQGTQTICGGAGTLADLKVTGSGIVWYDALTGGNKLPLSTVLVDNTTYYAAQSSDDCESDRIPVLVTSICYTVHGTMFPFVYEGDPAFDGLFPVTVKLHNVPPADAWDPIEYVLDHEPVYTTNAFYYDGSIYVAGTPKNPGKIGVSNNPGLPINWAKHGKNPGTVDNTPVTGVGDVPTAPVGMYTFTNVAPGDYIIEIGRVGFITRWGKISINSNSPLGHREILSGDIDGDLEVTTHDMSKINNRESMYGSPKYDPKYDFNGDGQVKQYDTTILMFDLNASIELYIETTDWIY